MRAKDRLAALVNAIMDVREDPAALKFLAEQLELTRDGTGTDVEDLQRLATLALAHALREEPERIRGHLWAVSR